LNYTTCPKSRSFQHSSLLGCEASSSQPHGVISRSANLTSRTCSCVNCVSGKTGVNVWANPWTQQVARRQYSSITHTSHWFMVPSCTCCLSVPRPYIRCKDRVKCTCWVYYSGLARKWVN
jgi:hypothetical protein